MADFLRWHFLIKNLFGFVLLFILSVKECSSFNDNNNDEIDRKLAENRLAVQLFAILDHYKQEDPLGIPGVPVPDPMDVPDISQSMGVATMSMKSVKAYGLSKFRLKDVQLNLEALKVRSKIQLDELEMKGSYTLSSFFTKANGPFVVILKNVSVVLNGTMGVERDGKVRTQDIEMDIGFAEMAMDFKNLGFLGSIFQSVVNSAPNAVFDSIKPFMLKEAYNQIRQELDTNIEKALGGQVLPNSISPLDMAIAEGRKQMRIFGYDPYRIDDYNHTAGVFSIKLTNTWVAGVSSFYRVNEMSIAIKNSTAVLRFNLGTRRITGATQWELSMGKGIIGRTGYVQFTVEHIKAIIELDQPLDIRKKPKIEDLQIDLGNIQIRSNGAGTLDYLVEFVVNLLPNLLRYQIIDAIENPIKVLMQERLNQINVEATIKKTMHDLVKMEVI